jgi:plastocyanin
VSRTGRRSSIPWGTGLALLAAAIALAGCGGGGASSSGPVETTSVDLPKSYKFVPPAIAVENGATVTWNNRDDFTHNVTFEGDDPLTMAPGETASRDFATPGVYPYTCTLHPTEMTGSVTVA